MVMRALVTGGTGFVGANLVRLLLQEGYAVRALVRPTSRLDNLRGLEVEIVKGDLSDPDLWRQMVGCQVLFHAAAHYSLWQADREALYHHNVLGTRNILAAACRSGIERTVYTSSVAAIGVGTPGTILDETYQSPLNQLVGHYKKSKFLAEQEALQAARSGQEVVIVNPTTPIGPWDIKPTPYRRRYYFAFFASANARLCGYWLEFYRCARCGTRTSISSRAGSVGRSLHSGIIKTSLSKRCSINLHT